MREKQWKLAAEAAVVAAKAMAEVAKVQRVEAEARVVASRQEVRKRGSFLLPLVAER
jgi:hypothetical protein